MSSFDTSSFTAKDFEAATSKKKKKPGVGPVSIMPPVMPDWSAGVGQAAAPAPSDAVGPDIASVMKKRQMQSAVASPTASPFNGLTQEDFGPTGKYSGYPGGRYGSHPGVQHSPELTVAGAASPAGAQTQPQEAQPAQSTLEDQPPSAAAQAILDRQRRQMLQRQFSQMAGGASPEQIAKADTMAEMRYEREALDRSGRPIQKVQSPDEIAGARYNIGQSLMQNADVIHKRAMDAIAANPQMQQTDPAQYAKLMEDVSRAENMRATAQTKLAPYTVGDVENARGISGDQGTGPIAKIMENQRMLAARQMGDRAAGAELNEPYQTDANATRAQGFKMRELARGVERASGETTLAQTQLEGARAKLEADPKVMEERLKAEQMRAMQESRVAGAQGRAEVRGAAYEVAGLGSEGSIKEFNERARKIIQSGDPAEFELTIVPQLRQIAEIDPAEAERLARGLEVEINRLNPGMFQVFLNSLSPALGAANFADNANRQRKLRESLRINK